MRCCCALMAFLFGCGAGPAGGGGGRGPDPCTTDPSADCAEICDDEVDNDLDGLTDCSDSDCIGQCPEICDDGIDNDGDSKLDCIDEDCLAICDKDGDGFLDLFDGGGDCNDFSAAVYPGATEVCDGLDNDCNGLVDREDPGLDPSSLLNIARDADGDGYGDPSTTTQECFVPAGMVENADDCNDRDPNRHPGAIEVCNSVDDNCDGLIDDQDPLVDLSAATTYWADADGDGLGDPNAPAQFCRQPQDHADNPDDCDDTSPYVTGPSEWVPDADGDGFGAGTPVGPVGCSPPPAYPDYVSADLPVDCDETDPSVYPGAPETCLDYVDSDCDGSDCPIFTEDFESGTMSSDFSLSGNADWFVQAATVHTGSYAAECGNIGNNQVSTLQLTAVFGIDGAIEFWHTGDTENSWDFLQFYVDGTLVASWSGYWSWERFATPVPAGTHTFEWRYDKDGSVSTGADTVWVDDIVVTNGAP